MFFFSLFLFAHRLEYATRGDTWFGAPRLFRHCARHHSEMHSLLHAMLLLLLRTSLCQPGQGEQEKNRRPTARQAFRRRGRGERNSHVSIQFHKKYNDQFWSNKIISRNTLNVCRGINLRAFSKLLRFKYVLINMI